MHLEHAIAVWDPHLTKNKQELESVQHFACNVCTKSWDDAYCDMLCTLNIPPLSERIEETTKTVLQNCLRICWVDCPNAPLLYMPCTNYFTRYTCTSSHSPTTTDSHKLLLFLFSHAVAIWNSLSCFVVSLPNISMFKKSFVNFNNLSL